MHDSHGFSFDKGTHPGFRDLSGSGKSHFTFLRLGNPPSGNAEVLKSWEPAIADDDDDDDDDDGEDEDGFISNFSPFPANVLRFVVDHELHPMQLMRLGRFPWR